MRAWRQADMSLERNLTAALGHRTHHCRLAWCFLIVRLHFIFCFPRRGLLQHSTV